MRLAASIGRGIKRAVMAFTATFAARDHLLFGGLALIAYGLSLIYWPAAFIVPGVVLVGVSILGVR